MRVGLVLGAGGIQGGAWLTGGLDALATRDRLGPGHGRVIVGTSAGSMIGSLVRRGPPALVHGRPLRRARSSTASSTPRGAPRPRPTGPPARSSASSGRWPPIGPGSWELALRVARRPAPLHARRGVRRLASARASSRPSRSRTSSAASCRDGWSPHPNLWVVACDYATGRRVAVRAPRRRRRPSSPTRSPPPARSPASTTRSRSAAAATSTAACTRPPTSTSSAHEELDLVICLNPTSSLHPTRAWNPAEWVARAVRSGTGRRLGTRGDASCATAGTEVVLVQPTQEDLDAMGPNLMSRRNRQRTIEVAQRTVAEQLRRPENRELLAQPCRRAARRRSHGPDAPPSEWPDLLELAAASGRLTASGTRSAPAV